jgi:hypothetical protein
MNMHFQTPGAFRPAALDHAQIVVTSKGRSAPSRTSKSIPAYIVHCTPKRLRIKIPARRCQDAFFSDLAWRLSQYAGVIKVEGNPLTASLLIAHNGSFDVSTLRHPSLGLDLVDCDGPRPRQVSQRLADCDRASRASLGGEINLASALVRLAFAAITGQLGVQLLEWCAEGFVRVLLEETRRLRPSAPPRLLAPSPQNSALLAAA